MSQSFIVAVLSFTLVMLTFNIVKDFYIRYNSIDISDEFKKRIDRRWLISYTIGVIILFLLYGRDGP